MNSEFGRAPRGADFRWELRSGGRPLLISHESYASQSTCEIEGRIEMQKLNEKWQATHDQATHD
jgi:hypothetical protein